MGRRWVVACVAVCAAAGCGDGGKLQIRAAREAVAVEPSTWDFGDVALGREERTTLVVRNDGIRETTVASIPGTNREPDFEVTGLPLQLRPGETARVEARFHPTTLGQLASRVQLATALSVSPTVDLRGHAVKGLAQLSLESLDFGDVVVNHTATMSFTINNGGRARTDVRIDAMGGPDGPAFRSSRTGTISLGPGESVNIDVSFTPSHLGPAQATMPVTPCPTCTPLPFVLSGQGVEGLLDVQPPRLDFGLVLLSESKELPFTLRNTSKKSLQVTGAAVPAGDMSVQMAGNPPFPITLAPGQQIGGTARFTPTRLGLQQRTASFSTSDGAPGQLLLAGTGYGPMINARPNPFDMEAASIGTSRPKKLTITNIGLDPTMAAPLIVNRITLQGDPSFTFGAPPMPWRIGAPGNSGVVTVAFTPTSEGYVSATLVIESNDGLTPSLTVPIKALGRRLPPCQVTFYPSNRVDFGLAPIFHPTTQGYELINSGADDCIFSEADFLSGGPEFHWPGNVQPAGRTIPPGGRMSVRVEFTPEREGEYFGRMSFYMSNPGAQTQYVDLHGFGDAGCFYVTPGAVDFGGAPVGCSLPQQYAYATNTCSQPVIVTNAQVTPGPFAIQGMPPLPFTVPPYSQVPIALGYTAATVGDDVASLQVYISTRGTPFQVGLTAGALKPATVNDAWDQTTPKVDMLIVIDNSGSMDEEQKALAANLDRLWNRIALANADFHIAVTSTGMSPYTAGWSQCPGGAQGGEGGRFFPVDGSRPRILTPTTANVKQALFDNTKVGLCHWREQFLEPVVAALTPPLSIATKAPGTSWPADGNAGFLRDDARLALLAVSDADDENDDSNPPPVSGYIQKLAAAKHGALDLISFAGIVALHMCPTVEGIGNRYMEISRQLNGHLYDICDLSNFGPMLDNALGNLLQPLSSFKLSAFPRDPSQIAVSVNGAAVSGFRYDASTNRIVFSESAVPPAGSHITASYLPACN